MNIEIDKDLILLFKELSLYLMIDNEDIEIQSIDSGIICSIQYESRYSAYPLIINKNLFIYLIREKIKDYREITEHCFSLKVIDYLLTENIIAEGKDSYILCPY